MKIRKKSCCYIKNIALLVILIVSVDTINGQDAGYKYSRGNSQLMKTQARAREVRGFRPGNLQTARDFGKRNDHFVDLKDLHFHRPSSKRYPIHWFLERGQRYPRITMEYKRILLNANDREDLKTRLLLESIKIL